MNLQTFTSFEGRIGRQTWWLGQLLLLVLQWVLMLVFGGFGMASFDPNNPEAASAAAMAALIPIGIICLIFLWPTLALYTKRWHDRNKSGWWSLIILIPLIGALWAFIECGFLRGTEGSNNYGADPIAD